MITTIKMAVMTNLVSVARHQGTPFLGCVEPRMRDRRSVPPNMNLSISAARIAPRNWNRRYGGVSRQGNSPVTASAIVTAGLRCAPEAAAVM